MSAKTKRSSRTRSAILLVPFLIPACAAPRSPLPDTEIALAQLQPAYSGTAVTGCLATPLASQRNCRDTVVQAMMVGIDLRYAEFEIAFFDASRGIGFGSSVAVLGLGSAGALAATGTAQVFNALSAAITGTREAFGRELLAEQTAPALLSAMRTARNEVALRVRDGLRRDATDYPLGVALSDLYAYYRAGTLPGAIAGLTQLAGNQAQITQDELRRATPVALGNPARCLQRMLGDESLGPVARAANRQRMRTEMDRLGIPAALRPDQFAFGTDSERAAQQLTVAQRLGCPL